MLANVFSDPFWLKVTQGLLLSSLSFSMPCFTCHVQVMYHVVLLLRRGLRDLKFQTSVNFTKSGICFAFAFLHACLNLIMDELAVAQC